tara:strand:+ start:162 stop:1361 length:1200 start_codon:yes stop_codon:yes gene_type:complete
LIVLFHPNLVARGGSQKYIIDYFNYLRFTNKKVFLVTYNYSTDCYPEIIKQKDIIFVNKIKNEFKKKVFRPYFIKILLSFFNEFILNFKLIRKISKYFDFNKIEIFFQHELQFNFLSLKFKKSKRFLFLYDSKNKLYFFDKGKNLNVFDNFMIKILSTLSNNYFLKKFNEIFVLEEVQKKDVDKRYSINSKVIYGYYNEKKFFVKKKDFIRKKFNLPISTKIFFSLSRFSKYKKIEHIFDFIHKVNYESNVKTFTYIKSMKDDLEYQELITSRYKDLIYPKGNIYIDFETSKNENELFDLYNSSDIFLFPSMNQTWGNAVLESIACGQIPLISDNCGISMLLIENNLGKVYKFGNIEDMYNSFLYILNNFNNFENSFVFVKNNLNFKSHIKKIENYIYV